MLNSLHETWHNTISMLFDTHCHLDFETFGNDFDAIVARAKAAGVTRIATIGSGRDVASASAAVDIARRMNPFVVATVAVHPHDARVVDDTVFDDLRALCRDPLVVAVGETGLDYHYDHSPRDVQQRVFRQFIALAKELKKPIIVHTREAADDTLQVLREERASDVGGIIHCFSENALFAKQALDLGFVSSFSGIVTFKNAQDIQDAARKQPLDAILLETDAPFLAPIPFRGKRNEPSYVAHTCAFVAKLRNMEDAELRARSYENAMRVFQLQDAT